ncbi:aspartyl-phosphate phosphatase Spo0E family protein [Paenibacillus sp. sgz302251]|uniref:aspartyl-phosphate phosphatase Spo0E family protein n=1 Tax=Paenibacillus sp. sgz302251 TaxID=3414493 RepID=UPI003C7DD47D
MDKHLLTQMEQLRNMMMETAQLKQSLLHHDVLILSQSLDEIILQVQEERRMLSRFN